MALNYQVFPNQCHSLVLEYGLKQGFDICSKICGDVSQVNTYFKRATGGHSLST